MGINIFLNNCVSVSYLYHLPMVWMLHNNYHKCNLANTAKVKSTLGIRNCN